MAKTILIKGAGIAGLVSGFILQQKGYDISVLAPETAPKDSASWFAGGMLAPYCERENAEQIVEDLGIFALDWWQSHFPNLVQKNGTLVVAAPRDETDLALFATKTHKHRSLSSAEIQSLEPDLAGRFQKALFFEEEAHLDPRLALLTLKARLVEKGAVFLPFTNEAAELLTLEKNYDIIIDSTGIHRLAKDDNLRGVRGEMLLLRSFDISLSRPIRLLHPRIPLYIVPRKDKIFMLGATMIESEHDGPCSVRSAMEFLNAAYALHPAFSEAEILELGTGVRPAYCDNFPKIIQEGKYFYLNGFYRHGYLLAPHMALKLCQKIGTYQKG